jgi:hypothetical protein
MPSHPPIPISPSSLARPSLELVVVRAQREMRAEDPGGGGSRVVASRPYLTTWRIAAAVPRFGRVYVGSNNVAMVSDGSALLRSVTRHSRWFASC